MTTNNSSRREQYVEELAARFGVSVPVFDRGFSDVSTALLREMASGERTIDVDTGGAMVPGHPGVPGVPRALEQRGLPRVNRDEAAEETDTQVAGALRALEEEARVNRDGAGEETDTPVAGALGALEEEED